MVPLSAFILLVFNGIALAHAPNDHPKRSTPAETPNNSTHLAKLRQPSGNLSVPNVNCDGSQHRYDLEYPSCADALFLIPKDDRRLRFAPHTSTLDFDMPLPFRWISGTLSHPLPPIHLLIKGSSKIMTAYRACFCFRRWYLHY